MMIRKMLVYSLLGAVAVGAAGLAYPAASDGGLTATALVGGKEGQAEAGGSDRHGDRPHDRGREARHERD
jgi:hypothetical protein